MIRVRPLPSTSTTPTIIKVFLTTCSVVFPSTTVLRRLGPGLAPDNRGGDPPLRALHTQRGAEPRCEYHADSCHVAVCVERSPELVWSVSQRSSRLLDLTEEFGRLVEGETPLPVRGYLRLTARSEAGVFVQFLERSGPRDDQGRFQVIG